MKKSRTFSEKILVTNGNKQKRSNESHKGQKDFNTCIELRNQMS